MKPKIQHLLKLEYCAKVQYFKVVVTKSYQPINFEHLQRFSEPLNGLCLGQ